MSSDIKWDKNSLISIEPLSDTEIKSIFSLAQSYKSAAEHGRLKFDALEGRTIINLFLEPSTRTRLAFEIASKRLSAETLTISGDASSLSKGESLKDTARNIVALGADIIIMRHASSGAAEYLSNTVDIPIINAGDGSHAHPTQALLDCFTLTERLGSLKKKKVTILGDILFSRVARSNIHCLKKLGADVTLAGPNTLVPKAFESMGVRVSHNLKEALEEADAIMLLRIQHERQTSTHFPSIGEYTTSFGLNERRAHWLKPNAIIMHPGPINRGVEIDSKLADSKHSVILDQVKNGVFVRMALLHLCYAAHKNQTISITEPTN